MPTDRPSGWVLSDVGPDKCRLQFMLHVREGYAEMILAFSLHDGYGDLDILTAAFTEPRVFKPDEAPDQRDWRLPKKTAIAITRSD